MPHDRSARRKAADAISEGKSLDWSRLNEDGELSEGEVKAFRFLELMQQIRKKEFPPDGADRSRNPVQLDTGFEIVEELGQGAYSTVYRAQDKALDREVALKELKSDLPMTSHQLERFIREARVLAALDHPNIVRIHSIDQKEGRVRLCLERIRGHTLTKLVEEEKPLSPERAARIGLELSRALKVLHGRGLVHRDLKPSNVMYTPDNRAVLLDFGLTHSLGPGDVVRSRGMTGTPLFMAPEQFVPGSAIDESVDIYALGVVLYWMTSGDFPFEGEDFYALRDRVLKGECVPLEERRPGIPAAFVDIVSRAMAVRPRDRFKSAEEMEKSLAEFLGQSPPGGVRAAERGAPDSSRGKLWAAAFLSILAGLAVVLISIGFHGTGGVVQPSLKMDRDAIRSIIASKPGRERIVFSMAGESEEKNDIYMLNPVDSSLVNLTSKIQGKAFYPRISPSGSRIAFRVTTTLKSEIWCMDADGKPAWMISPFDRFDNPQKLEWYDEETLWITADSKDGDTAIFSMRIDEPQADLVVDSVSPKNHRPFGFKISPDGRSLVICGAIAPRSPDSQDGADLFLADVIDDSRIGNIRPFFLDDDSRRNWTPLWSRDSSMIYWIRNGGQGNGCISPSLVWKHVRSSKSTDEYDAAISLPESRTAGNQALSMDGSRFLISLDGKLLTLDPKTGEGAQVFAGAREDFFKGVDWGCLRNEKIVLSTPGREKDSSDEYDIFSINPYYGESDNLTRDFHEEARHPKLSPDGRRIAFCSSSEGGRHVWVMNCDGSAKKRLTRNARSELCYIQDWWDDESLIFCGKDENREHEYSIVNLLGEERPWPHFQPHRDILRLALRRSPTGREMAVIVARGERMSPKIKIYIQDLQSRELTLFFQGETGYPGVFPLWSPDGNILCWSYGRLKKEKDHSLDPRLDVVYKYRNSRKGIDEFDGIVHPKSEGGVWPCGFSPWGGKILLRHTITPRGVKLFTQDLETREREVLFKAGQIFGDCDWDFLDYGNRD